MYARPKSESKGSKRGPWTQSQRLSSQPAEHDGKEQIVYTTIWYIIVIKFYKCTEVEHVL